MKQIALTIEQMKHLQELGVDISKATMRYERFRANILTNGEIKFEWGKWNLCLGFNSMVDANNYQVRPAFTLQDILELLPEYIGEEYQLQIIYPCIAYRHFKAELEDFIYKNRIDIMQNAYQMLCWVAESGYLKNKEDKQ